MKTIELNEQQIDFLKEHLEEMANNYRNLFSVKYQSIAQQIISKLEQEI